MRIIKKFVFEFVFIVLYVAIVWIMVYLSENIFPKIIFGTWVSYIVIAILANVLGFLFEATFILLFFVFGLLKQKSVFTKVICTIVSLAGLFISLGDLWSFTSALFYAGVIEYLWSTYLSFIVVLMYGALIYLLLFKRREDDYEESVPL